MVKLRCEICRQDIGTFEPETLGKPLLGKMFGSIMPRNGLAPPFHASLTWEDMRCPYCRMRPFLTQDYLMTPDGKYNLLSKDELIDKLVGEYDPEPPAAPEVEPERELTEDEKKNAEIDKLMGESFPTKIDKLNKKLDSIIESSAQKTTKTCPYCTGEFKALAIHLRFCKSKPGPS